MRFQDVRTVEDVVQLVTTDLEELTRENRITARPLGDLLVLNYTPRATHLAEWLPVERFCRGLIVNRVTGEIVARPFDKFFNWGEGGRTTNADIVRISEKMDGSEGILFRYDGTMRVSTRGSMTSWQAEWATQFLRERCDVSSIPDAYTPIVEIICPENRIVVDYGQRQELTLLAIRNRFTGEYVDIEEVREIAHRCGFGRPQVWRPTTVDALVAKLSTLSANEEGFVAEFSDGQRFKFKGEAYRSIARVVQHFSFDHAVECVAQGTVGQVRAVVPAAIRGKFEEWVEEILQNLSMSTARIGELWQRAPRSVRKDFALFVIREDRALAPVLFARLDGQDERAALFKALFGYRMPMNKEEE
jgi:RNA ligase